MDKYRKVMKPKGVSDKGEEEIRVTATGGVSAYVSRAAKLFNELEKEFITIAATGNALTKAVTSAEVIKRRFKGLHQVTKLGSQDIVDEYEPLEEGLDNVCDTRSVPWVEIKLSKEPLDTSDKGYQAPLDESEVTEFDPEEMAKSRGRGRGQGKGRGKSSSEGGKGKGSGKGKGKGKWNDEEEDDAPKGKGKGKGKGKTTGGWDDELDYKGKSSKGKGGKGKGGAKDFGGGKDKSAKGDGYGGRGGWESDYDSYGGSGKGKSGKSKGGKSKGWEVEDDWYSRDAGYNSYGGYGGGKKGGQKGGKQGGQKGWGW